MIKRKAHKDGTLICPKGTLVKISDCVNCERCQSVNYFEGKVLCNSRIEQSKTIESIEKKKEIKKGYSKKYYQAHKKEILKRYKNRYKKSKSTFEIK